MQVEVILATILKERRHFEAIKKRTQKGCFWLLESFGWIFEFKATWTVMDYALYQKHGISLIEGSDWDSRMLMSSGNMHKGGWKAVIRAVEDDPQGSVFVLFREFECECPRTQNERKGTGKENLTELTWFHYKEGDVPLSTMKHAHADSVDVRTVHKITTCCVFASQP